MSVIIRLQNLPWSANAADIRLFFHGLSIPEGGVHIVGGALGDAFIAFSTDEDARQGMAADGGLLKDSRVKLFLSSRTEMQKIIEETRQQHLAMQAAASGVPAAAAAAAVPPPRQFTTGPFAPIPHANPVPPVRPAAAPSQMHPAGYPDQSFMYQQQQQQQHQQQQPVFNQRMLAGPANPAGGSHMAAFQNQQQQQPNYGGGYDPHYGDKRMRAEEMPLDPYRNPSGHETRNVYHHHQGGVADRRHGRTADSSPLPDGDGRNNNNSRNDADRYRNKDGRRDRRERDKDRGDRRGRRSRSRSGSRGRGRDRNRRRSRSDSRERSGRNSRDRNGKQPTNTNPPASSKSPALLPTPADGNQGDHPAAAPTDATSVQLRLLAGDLTYRDIRDYLSGIHVPNTCIKMINALDGYRFGLAYIQFPSKMDKVKALARHNGTIRGYPVQILHVEDSAFHQAIDSYSPGVNLDPKSLSKSCLALRDFPPTAAAHNVREAFGAVSIGQVLPERNESGTVTGLCYTELSSEADARRAVQLLKDGVMICGRPVKMAFLPVDELAACAKNLDRLRNVVGSGSITNSLTSFNDSPLSPGTHPAVGPQRPGPPQSRLGPAGSNGSGYVQQPRVQQVRVFIAGLPPTAMERDIGDFFSDVGVIPQTIEIVYDQDRAPVGNAFCQFANGQDAERALDKNGGFMGGHTVSVTLVDNTPNQRDSPPPPHPPQGQQHDMANHFNPLQYPVDSGMPRDYGHSGGPPPYRPSMNNNDGNGFNNPSMGGHPPRFNGPRFGGGPRYGPSGSNGRGGGGGGGGYGPPRPPRSSMGNMRMRMPGSGGGGGGGRGGSDDGSPTPGFGAPGCVVALANVHHKAIIADILDFFRGFQVNEKCVIRRFGPNGEPTGDARVAFPSPDEAEAAVRTLQNEYLLNRRVMLSIV